MASWLESCVVVVAAAVVAVVVAVVVVAVTPALRGERGSPMA